MFKYVSVVEGNVVKTYRVISWSTDRESSNEITHINVEGLNYLDPNRIQLIIWEKIIKFK